MDLVVPNPTEEEREESRIWWENFHREGKEIEERRKEQFEEWEREMHPVRTFFQDFFNRFLKSK